MQVTSFSAIDPEFHGFLTDFVFSVKNIAKAQACILHLTNNIINVVLSSGKVPSSSADLVISTKERTHINCRLSLYNPKNLNTALQFHLKLNLEILRKLIEAKLQLFFRKEWQNKAFFFETKPSLESTQKICSKLHDYVNRFIDIELIGITYISPGRKEFFSVTDKYKTTLQYFSQAALIYLQNCDNGSFSKQYSEYYLVARKVSSQFLCLLFKGEPHPIYLTAISFILNELLMMFNTINWINLEKEAEERFRIVANYTADWEYWEDPEGNFLYVSPSCQEITGYPAEAFYEDPSLYERIIYHEDRPIWQKHKLQTHVDRKTTKDPEIEFRIITADGELRWISHVCNPVYTKDGTVYTKDGKFRGFRGSNRDITYRKRLEERVLQAEKLESIARLAGGVAHDLNNLMAMVVGHAELLNMKLPPEAPERKHAWKIFEAAQRASTLAEQLLTYATGSSIKSSLVSLNEIVEEILRLQEQKTASLQLCVSLEENLWPILADPSQISQVLLNLVANAAEAMPHGGTLSVSTRNVDLKKGKEDMPPGRYVLLQISDTGCGMEKKVLNRIFDPFFSTKDFGRGLGLSTVYGIVRHTGGYIFVHSTPGEGTTFEIFFPAAGKNERRKHEERSG